MIIPGNFRNFAYSLPPWLAPTLIVGSQQLEFPVTNVLLNEEPRKPWRTDFGSTGSTQDLIFDFGSSIPLGALYVVRTNYPLVQLATSPDNITYTGITLVNWPTSGGSFVINFEPTLLRRYTLFDLTGITTRYLRYRIPSGQTTDDGANYYETGAITLAGSFTMYPLLMQFPWADSVVEPSLVREFISSSKKYKIRGDTRHLFTFGGLMVNEVTIGPIRAINAIRQDGFLFFPNIQTTETNPASFDPSQAYLVRRISERTLNYPDIPQLLTVQWQAEEIS